MPSQIADEGVLDARVNEFEFAAFVDKTAGSGDRFDELVPLLHGGHPVYGGRGSNQVARMRGYLIASLKDLGPPVGALIYVLELLENSQTPYLVAAAARALRHITDPSEELVDYLRYAISNIQYRDEPISFDCYAPEWPRDQYTSALEEIVATLAVFAAVSSPARSGLSSIRDSDVFNSRIREQADEALNAIEHASHDKQARCCAKEPARKPLALEHLERAATNRYTSLPRDVWFEDQDGQRTTFEKAFIGKPSVVGFFYTRCGNPNKCSMTVSKLAELRLALRDQGVHESINIAGMTYDPAYDTPHRLHSYCQDRGFDFDDMMRAWRTDPKHFKDIRSFFDLGVSYASSVVSRHEIEVYVLDKEGLLAASFTKLQLDVEKLAQSAIELL